MKMNKMIEMILMNIYKAGFICKWFVLYVQLHVHMVYLFKQNMEQLKRSSV